LVSGWFLMLKTLPSEYGVNVATLCSYWHSQHRGCALVSGLLGCCGSDWF